MAIYWKKNDIVKILLTAVMSFMIVGLFIQTAYNSKNLVGPHSTSEKTAANDILFVLNICKGGSVPKQAVQFTSDEMQLRQVKVHLKSAVTLTSRRLTYIIICNDYSIFESISSYVSTWPSKYQKMLRLQYRPIFIPPYADILEIYAKCATERLFMPWALPEVDAAVYVDTDTFFLQSPEGLSDFILDFDDKQMIGAVQVDGFYLQENIEIPYYGEKGMSSTPLVVNLTRWRQLPFDWMLIVNEVWKAFRDRSGVGGDQDILNLIFSEFPQYVYDIGCEWNGSIEQCLSVNWVCDDVEHRGFKMVHGARWRFFREEIDGDSRMILPMKAMFTAWEEHPLGAPVSLLLKTILDKFELLNDEFMKPRLVNGTMTQGASICDFDFRKLLKPLQNEVNKARLVQYGS